MPYNRERSAMEQANDNPGMVVMDGHLKFVIHSEFQILKVCN